MTPIRKCAYCGKEYQPLKCSRYCSVKCNKKAYGAINKEYFTEKTRAWRKKNPEKAKARRKAEYWQDPEGNRQKTKDWLKANPEKKAQWRRIYNDKIRHGGIREKLIAEQGYRCSVCGREGQDFKLSAHHTDTKDNHIAQILVCQSCHRKLHTNQRAEVQNEGTLSING